MGTVKVTNIEPIADNGTVTLGSSGDTFALASGAKQQLLRPAWAATLSTDQSITSNTTTKVQFAYEILDTDGAYDPTTNYRFTVPSGKAGKYFVTARLCVKSSTETGMKDGRTLIYKNGSQYSFAIFDSGNPGERISITNSEIIDLSENDYIEIYTYILADGSPTLSLDYVGSGQGDLRCSVNGYRIGD